MILEAFWKGDAETLAWLTEADVRDAFTAAINERTTAGHVLDNRLIAVEQASVVDAGLDGKVARITMRFDAAIAAVTRDADGQVVAGSPELPSIHAALAVLCAESGRPDEAVAAWAALSPVSVATADWVAGVGIRSTKRLATARLNRCSSSRPMISRRPVATVDQ